MEVATLGMTSYEEKSLSRQYIWLLTVVWEAYGTNLSIV